MIAAETEEKGAKKAPAKPPRACPFLSSERHTTTCILSECMIYNHLIKQCGIVDLAITMHEIEKYLIQLLGTRVRSSLRG